MVSSERPDHSWSLAIRTRGGSGVQLGHYTLGALKVACRISRNRMRIAVGSTPVEAEHLPVHACCMRTPPKT